MDITYIPPEKQGLLLLYSLIVGYLSGILCGIVRTPSEILKRIFAKKKFCIIISTLFDIITSIINTIVIIIFIYAANGGIIRYFLIVSALIGVLLYKISIGKLFNKLSYALSEIIIAQVKILTRLIKKVLYPLKRSAENRCVMRYIEKRFL